MKRISFFKYFLFAPLENSNSSTTLQRFGVVSFTKKTWHQNEGNSLFATMPREPSTVFLISMFSSLKSSAGILSPNVMLRFLCQFCTKVISSKSGCQASQIKILTKRSHGQGNRSY